MRARVEVFQQPALLGERCLAGQVRAAGSPSLRSLSGPFVVSVGAKRPWGEKPCCKNPPHGCICPRCTQGCRWGSSRQCCIQRRLFPPSRSLSCSVSTFPGGRQAAAVRAALCRSSARGNPLRLFRSSWRSPESQGKDAGRAAEGVRPSALELLAVLSSVLLRRVPRTAGRSPARSGAWHPLV